MRAAADAPSTDVVSATMRMGADLGATEPVAVPDHLEENSPDALYESVLFHRGLLRRVGRYELLTAYRLRAWVRCDPHARWFSSFHDGRLRLGDPGLLDAALHSLLPMVPTQLALPIACSGVDVGQLPDGWLLVTAQEVSHSDTDYMFTSPSARRTVRSCAGGRICGCEMSNRVNFPMVCRYRWSGRGCRGRLTPQAWAGSTSSVSQGSEAPATQPPS